APSTTTAASRATIAIKLRFIFASGESPGITRISSPARAAEINPIAQPANMPGTPASPASRRVGTIPSPTRTAVTATTNPRKRAYLVAFFVIAFGFAHCGHRCPYQVVKTANDADDHSDE